MINHSVSDDTHASLLLLGNQHSVEKLAKLAIISMAEAAVDMACDVPEEYKTKEDIEKAFDVLNVQAAEYMDDVLLDITTQLRTYLQTKRYRAVVRGLEYSEDGRLSDVKVDIEFI